METTPSEKTPVTNETVTVPAVHPGMIMTAADAIAEHKASEKDGSVPRGPDNFGNPTAPLDGPEGNVGTKNELDDTKKGP